MAFDGVMLRLVKRELEEKLILGRADKIHQPTRDEIIITMRTYKGAFKLMISSKADASRINITNAVVENPKQPPMFCMLMRKHIGSGKLVALRQREFDRVLFLDFEALNEMGDLVTVSLAVEIMGRHSNLIMIDQNGKIIDALKRVSPDMSSVRTVMPGMRYELPPPQDKISPESTVEEIEERLFSSDRDVALSKLLLENIEGISPVISREISHFVTRGRDTIKSEITAEERDRLRFYLKNFTSVVKGEVLATPTIISTLQGVLKDVAFLPINQYSSAMLTKEYGDFSEMLDAFYGGKDAGDRMRQRSNDLLKLIAARSDRVTRKLAVQKKELLELAERDRLREIGDILSANLHMLEKGLESITLQNFYSEGLEDIEIALDSKLTPTQNIQKYYIEYRKADTAEKMLHELLKEGSAEQEYLDNVFDLLARAKTDAELTAIREELAEGGYIRHQSGKKGSVKLAPLKYISSDGFTILCGRNNLQNDKLTLKDSKNYDLWLHTQKIPGSHVVILSEGKEIPNKTIEEAAIIAATNSKAGNSAKVPVDYTQIRYVKKHPANKPGLVNYDNFKTAIVDPDEKLLESLAVK